jgi:16S rRNA (uracil1498-N3)-methyltransferase
VNLLLLRAEDVTAPGRARISGRRATHVRSVLGKKPGDSLKVGLLNDGLGVATVLDMEDDSVGLLFGLTEAPPAASPVVLAVALPRPPMLRRVLQTAATFGVKQIHLFHAKRVEKSFWQSGALKEGDVREQLVLGLEQGRDTGLPAVHQHPRFRPFAEDVMPGLADAGKRLLADEDGGTPCPTGVREPSLLIVGPEGGFIPFELELMAANGAQTVTVGSRPLRVDVAVAALLGRLV